MQKPEVWRLVLAGVIPNKSDLSSNDWRMFVSRYLVPEIHQETLRFYGSADTEEALHPGLDYANPAHRLRLSAYPRHHQLFNIFDKLRLTSTEIHVLCKWDGTKLEKDKYERRQGRKIRDTTWDGVHAYEKRQPTSRLTSSRLRYSTLTSSVEDGEVHVSVDGEESVDEKMCDVCEDGSTEDESEDEVEQSVGVSLNQRLLAASEARARGEEAPLDADWEQWMREAMERGTRTDQNLPRTAGPAPTQAGPLQTQTQPRPQPPRRLNESEAERAAWAALVQSHRNIRASRERARAQLSQIGSEIRQNTTADTVDQILALDSNYSPDAPFRYIMPRAVTPSVPQPTAASTTNSPVVPS